MPGQNLDVILMPGQMQADAGTGRRKPGSGKGGGTGPGVLYLSQSNADYARDKDCRFTGQLPEIGGRGEDPEGLPFVVPCGRDCRSGLAGRLRWTQQGGVPRRLSRAASQAGSAAATGEIAVTVMADGRQHDAPDGHGAGPTCSPSGAGRRGGRSRPSSSAPPAGRGSCAPRAWRAVHGATLALTRARVLADRRGAGRHAAARSPPTWRRPPTSRPRPSPTASRRCR